MLMEEKLQHEIVRLLNTRSEGYETELLEQLAVWVDKNLISQYKIVRNAEYTKWTLEERR